MEVSLKPDALCALILRVLADGIARAPREISQPNNLNPPSTRKALLALVCDRRLTRTGEIGHYRYHLTAKQRDAA